MSDDAVFIPPVAAIPSRKTKDDMDVKMVFNPLDPQHPTVTPKPQRKQRKQRIAAVAPVAVKRRKRVIKKATSELELPAFKVLVSLMKLNRKTRDMVIELAKALP
jgi:hypothetical protein